MEPVFVDGSQSGNPFLLHIEPDTLAPFLFSFLQCLAALFTRVPFSAAVRGEGSARPFPAELHYHAALRFAPTSFRLHNSSKSSTNTAVATLHFRRPYPARPRGRRPCSSWPALPRLFPLWLPSALPSSQRPLFAILPLPLPRNLREATVQHIRT